MAHLEKLPQKAKHYQDSYRRTKEEEKNLTALQIKQLSEDD